MKLDEDKIDDAALALLRLTLHDERYPWKTMDWNVTDRLHRKGLIENPVGKSKSVLLTDEGLWRSKCLVETLLAQHDTGEPVEDDQAWQSLS